MKIVRVLANLCEGDEAFASARVVLLLGLNDDHCVAEGEWVGYLRSDSGVVPFVVPSDSGQLVVGEYSSGFATNLCKKRIRVGEMFSIGAVPGEADTWENVYQIASVYPYA